MIHIKTYEDITNSYLEKTEDPSEFFNGFIIYNNYLIEYDVEYHKDFNYSFNITSDEVDDEYIDDNYDDIKYQIVTDIKKGKSSTTEELNKIKIERNTNKYNL